MSPKVDFGLYNKKGEFVIHWSDNTGWWVTGDLRWVWLKNGDGWGLPQEELEGAALVAPLSILFWEDE